MSDPRLSSPSSIRLVAAVAAAVASLGVVALGVQLGTSGLVGDGPARNPGSNSASPASATVDLPRSRPGLTLEEQLVALVSGGGANAFGSSPLAGPGASSGPAPSGGGTATPSAPADGGAPAPAPGPEPSPPITTPAPPVEPPTPTPTLPAPTPTVPPALDPVVEPVTDTLSDLGAAPADESDSEAQPAPTTTLEDLIRLLLGP